MIHQKVFIILLTVLFSQFTNAGIRGGNGGDAVVCFSNAYQASSVQQVLEENLALPIELRKDPLGSIKDTDILSVDFLDLYDLKNSGIFDSKVSLISFDGMNLEESVNKMIENLSGKTQLGAELNKIKELQLKNDNWSAMNGSVLEISDSEHRNIFPNNCLLVQLGYQFKEHGKYKVHYSKRLFNKLEMVDKVAFILHEYFYHFIKYKHEAYYATDSRPVRQFIQKVFTEEFLTIDPISLAKFLFENFQKGMVNNSELTTIGEVEILGTKIFSRKIWAKGKSNNSFNFSIKIDKENSTRLEYSGENNSFDILPREVLIALTQENKIVLKGIDVYKGVGSIQNIFGRSVDVDLDDFRSIRFQNGLVSSLNFKPIGISEVTSSPLAGFITKLSKKQSDAEISGIRYYNDGIFTLRAGESNSENLYYWFSGNKNTPSEVTVGEYFRFSKYSFNTMTGERGSFYLKNGSVFTELRNSFATKSEYFPELINYLPYKEYKCSSNIIFDLNANVKKCTLFEDAYIGKRRSRKLVKKGEKICFANNQVLKCN